MKALIINCTLKSKEETSNTQAVIDKVVKIFESEEIETEVVRSVEYNIKPGVSSDEGAGDEWHKIMKKIEDCDIFIIGSSVWVGYLCSEAQKIIERMDAIFQETKFQRDNGQYITYNKVSGAICTGNEDGAHEVTWTSSLGNAGTGIYSSSE